MLSQPSEKYLARIIAVGAGFTTIFVVSGAVTDPVNVTKLLSLGIVSSMAFGTIIVSGLRNLVRLNFPLWAAVGLFLASALLSISRSSSPFSQNWFGVYGRNNGFLTYFFLAVLLLATVSLNSRDSLRRVILGLLVAGLVNVAYCLWVILFGDFVGWNNPYGNILGTLGNPNFIGSFLGIFLAAYLAYSLSNEAPRYLRYFAFIVIPITAYEIYDSKAIQGRVVGLAGIAIIGFFLLRTLNRRILLWIYSSFIVALGVTAVLGALQIGPLAALIYKTSISLRGQYWLAGWNVGQDSPISGVGMDSFGDWYRRARDARALELPGVNTVVNAAHNVPLDLFAFGGWPLLISYLMIMALAGAALLKSIVRTKHFDPILVILTTSWLGYQVQSLISINQIGLAIWGWVLTGAIIVYERNTRDASQIHEKVMKLSANTPKNLIGLQPKLVLSVTISGLFGLLLAIPPFSADSTWRSSQVARSLEGLEASLTPSYFNPSNVTKYLSNIETLEQSNLPELSRKYALEAVNWNPESFELWRVLYLIRASTIEEKRLAVRNMQRLDPLNPDVTQLK